MKHISHTLLALAVLSPAAFALDVKDDDLKLSLKLQLQVRAEKGSVTSKVGNPQPAAEGDVANTKPDDVDFYIRRARIGFAGTWKGEYKFAYLLRNDDQDKSTTATANASGSTVTSNRTPQTHYAYIERVIKQEDLGLEHSIKMGLDYAWFNGSNAVFSSSSFLFPTARATTDMLAPRGTGVAYKVSHKMVTWGFDIQNNTGDSTATNASDTKQSNNPGEGLFIGTRVQVIPFDSDEKGHMKPVESFLGKDGSGVLVSAEYGVNNRDRTTIAATGDTYVNTQGYGFELLGHYNNVTALAEYRQTVADATYESATNPALGDAVRQVATCYLVQVGYALPLGDQVIEPAFRWTHLNSGAVRNVGIAGSGNPNAAPLGPVNYSQEGNREYGSSGNSFDLGVNYYIHGHSNKLQLAWQHWHSLDDGTTATSGQDVTAKADIARLQWQLSF